MLQVKVMWGSPAPRSSPADGRLEKPLVEMNWTPVLPLCGDLGEDEAT